MIECLGRPHLPNTSRECSLPDLHPTSWEVTLGKGREVSCFVGSSGGNFKGLELVEAQELLLVIRPASAALLLIYVSNAKKHAISSDSMTLQLAYLLIPTRQESPVFLPNFTYFSFLLYIVFPAHKKRSGQPGPHALYDLLATAQQLTRKLTKFDPGGWHCTVLQLCFPAPCLQGREGETLLLSYLTKLTSQYTFSTQYLGPRAMRFCFGRGQWMRCLVTLL